MSDLELGVYALVGVCCVAILALVLNCTSHSLCSPPQKSPVQTGPGPGGDPKDHKHDWVWLGAGAQGPAAMAPAASPTLPAEARTSLDSLCHHTLPAGSGPALPERTATLGRTRASSQQHYRVKTTDPVVANHCATLLVRPQRSEPLHSPTSKRNQVQFTTFTTLDIKHLSALKKTGADLSWTAPPPQETPPQVPTASAHLPWPVVRPLGEPQ